MTRSTSAQVAPPCTCTVRRERRPCRTARIAREVDDEAVVDDGGAGDVVAAAADGERQSVLGGEADRGGDVGGVGAAGDHGRALVDHAVPDAAGGLVAGWSGVMTSPAQAFGEGGGGWTVMALLADRMASHHPGRTARPPSGQRESCVRAARRQRAPSASRRAPPPAARRRARRAPRRERAGERLRAAAAYGTAPSASLRRTASSRCATAAARSPSVAGEQPERRATPIPCSSCRAPTVDGALAVGQQARVDAPPPRPRRRAVRPARPSVAAV